MSPSEKLRIIVSVCLGIVIGFGVSTLLKRDNYSIHVISKGDPIKIDKRTGQSWIFAYSKTLQQEVWKPIASVPE